MTIYTATFRTDADYAEKTFKADTPEQALALARTFYDEHTEDLMFQSYDGGMGVNAIEITDPDGGELAVWWDDDLRLRLAASDLLEALQFCDMTLADLEASKSKGYIAQAITLTRSALAKAKGGAS